MKRVLPLLLAILAACGGNGSGRTSGEPPACHARSVLSVGETIPMDCRFRTLDGRVFALADLKGRPALINFWASWCPNCIDEMPALERASRTLGGRVLFVGADLLGVDGETESAAAAFARRTGVTYPIIFDTGGLLYAHFGARLLPPTTIWVDANGVIRHRQFGPLGTREILDSVRSYLGVH